MYSTRTMTPKDWRTIRYFTPHEFADPSAMGYEFIRWLDRLRARAGVPIAISSSYRTPAHNTAVGGAADSAHTDRPCNAVDIPEQPRPDDPNWNRTRWAIITTAITLGCRRVGTYADGSIHLDMTHDRRPAPRMWRIVGTVARFSQAPGAEEIEAEFQAQVRAHNEQIAARNQELYEGWNDIEPTQR